MYDVICIGDTTVDVFLRVDDASVLCNVDRERCTICLQYGSKIPVKHIMSVNGAGNAANCAVSFSRLGLKTAFYTIVGRDDRGRDIVKHLESERVSMKYLTFDRVKGTNYSSIIEYQGDRTILSYHEERRYRLPLFMNCRWVYFSSIAGNHETFNAALAKQVKKRGWKLAFNPGTHQMALGLKGLESILRVTSALFVNKEEAERLTEKKGGVKELLAALAALGPKIVAITDGQHGSYCYDGHAFHYLPIFESPVVQHTGCGDAYSSAFVAALAGGESVPEAMRWGTLNAASVIGQVGSQAGLLRRRELVKLLKKNKDFQARGILSV